MNKNEITPEKLAKMIDQTLLKPYVTPMSLTLAKSRNRKYL